MAWTDERVELAKRRFFEGASASTIALELGDCTRNAVIGLAHRKQWQHPNGRAARIVGTAVARPRAPPAPRIVRAIANHGNRFEVVGRAEAPALPPEPELSETIIPLGQRCTLLELNGHTCRWPIGDPGSPEFFFCGGSPIEGLPYCGYHSRVAYQPAVDRRRRTVR